MPSFPRHPSKDQPTCFLHALMLIVGGECLPDVMGFCVVMKVSPPLISMRDFEKVLLRARPTVSQKDLKVFEDFTKEFGEEG